MAKLHYVIVEHDGGWAYKVADVFSEAYASEKAAHAAAEAAAARQELAGPTETIQFQDDKGEWHEETAPGDDRPSTDVRD